LASSRFGFEMELLKKVQAFRITNDSSRGFGKKWDGIREGSVHTNELSPEKLLLRADTGKIVREAIDQSPEPYRVVLLLRDIEGSSTEETAKHIESNKGVVKVRLRRACNALKERLDPLFDECVMTWSTNDGWPMAINHIFLWHEGRIWTSTSGLKLRVKALRKRPVSCIVVSGMGNEIGAERSVSIKRRVKILDDRATKDWFYAAIAAKENPDNPDMAQVFVNLLDSPNRVILEHEPIKFISYDGIAVRDDLIAKITEIAAQN